MIEFTLKAPLASPEGFEPCSFFEQLALALGRMTGAMLPDGMVIDIGNDTLSNVSMQAIFDQAGVELFVFGSAPSNDELSTFLAMSDGTIWRIAINVATGFLFVTAHRTTPAEVSSDCSAVGEYVEGIKHIVAEALRSGGFAEKDDQINGMVKVNVHAAICMRVAGTGRFVINVGQTQAIRCGFSFRVDCPRPNAELEDVLSTLSISPMSPQEITAEQDAQKKAMGIASPFPVKVGEA